MQCTFHGRKTRQKQVIKIPKAALKFSQGTIPPASFPSSIPLFLPLSICSPPLLFLSIVSTMHPIQTLMTSLTAGSGTLREQWPRGNKSQFIRLESDRETDWEWDREREREEDREKEWHSVFHCGWTHIWWPCVTGAAGLMMGFLRPAQLGQASPDSQRERHEERCLSTGCFTICAFVYMGQSVLYTVQSPPTESAYYVHKCVVGNLCACKFQLAHS